MIKSNIREYFSGKSIDYIKKNNNHEIKLIEVGCMFTKKEGFSTLTLTNAIKNHKSKGILYSIELNNKNISSCIKILTNQLIIQKIS